MKKLIYILMALVFFIACEKEHEPEPESYFFIGNWVVDLSCSPHISEKESGWFISFVISDTTNNTVVIDTSYLSYIINDVVYCSDMYPSYFETFEYNFTDSSLYIDLCLNTTQHHVYDGKYIKTLDKFIGKSYYYEKWDAENLDLWSENDTTYKGVVECDVINE